MSNRRRLVYAIATMFMNLSASIMISLPAIYLLLLGNSYNVALYNAQLGAWTATLWIHED